MFLSTQCKSPPPFLEMRDPWHRKNNFPHQQHLKARFKHRISHVPNLIQQLMHVNSVTSKSIKFDRSEFKCNFCRIFDSASRIFDQSLTVALYTELYVRRIECIILFIYLFIIIIFLRVNVRENRAVPKDWGQPISFIFSVLRTKLIRLTLVTLTRFPGFSLSRLTTPLVFG